ncbi:hypothetical protein SAMN04488168_10880 [Bacillus sp. 491mf]|nr:hypothetical protein SAMN04488168_10880 [Bacillus sp. 491mf]
MSINPKIGLPVQHDHYELRIPIELNHDLISGTMLNTLTLSYEFNEKYINKWKILQVIFSISEN